jgi:Zn-dependent M28 family amino/carboxypeptidase
MSTAQQQERIRQDVDRLAGVIGERNVYRYSRLCETAAFIEESFRESGYHPARQEYEAAGQNFANVEVEIVGRETPQEIVVIGAHYDTERGSPGADDNGSGLAAVLALSRSFAEKDVSRTLRFVAFTNEERPFLRTANMGSRVYARRCRERGEKIAAMLSLEMLGCYSETRGSQWLSFFGLLYPDRGNFLLFVANRSSRALLDRATDAFRRHTRLPYETITLPSFLPGARSSDHWSFWKEGYPALMLTDTAALRYRHYHKPTDTPDKLRYDLLAEAVDGANGLVSDLVG